MIRLAIIAAVALPSAALAGPTLAEKTGTARPKLAQPPVFEECDPTDLSGFVGKPFDPTLRARALEASGARTIRIIRPNEPVTMDYGLERVNLELDAQGKVISARCG